MVMSYMCLSTTEPDSVLAKQVKNFAYRQIQCALYLKVSISYSLAVFVARTHGFFFTRHPGSLLVALQFSQRARLRFAGQCLRSGMCPVCAALQHCWAEVLALNRCCTWVSPQWTYRQISSPCLLFFTRRPGVFLQRARPRFSPDMVRWSAGNVEKFWCRKAVAANDRSRSMELLVWMKTTGVKCPREGGSLSASRYGDA